MSRRSLGTPRLRLIGSLILLTAVASSVTIAVAQTSPPAIVVSASLSAEPATQVPLPIRIGPPGVAPKGSFIRIRGLPPTVALSDGHSIAPGSWAIPIAALPHLKITLPAVPAGRSEITITLVGIDGSVLADAKSILIVTASDPSAQNPAAASPASMLSAGKAPHAPERVEQTGPSVPATAQARMAPEQRERALRLMRHGDEQLAQGGIAQARLLYERAAEAGLAQGAMALAATYDAGELERLGVRGLQPDRAAAQRWYERARQLGSAEAEQRLRRLGAN